MSFLSRHGLALRAFALCCLLILSLIHSALASHAESRSPVAPPGGMPGVFATSIWEYAFAAAFVPADSQNAEAGPRLESPKPATPTATTVSYTGMTSVNCNFNEQPVATIGPPVPGLTFSQLSRASGVTCASWPDGINGAGFKGDLATNAAGSKWFTLSITSDSATAFTVDGLSLISRVSSFVAGNTVDIQYSIGAGTKTSVGSYTPTTTITTYPITPSSTIAVGAGQTVNLFFIPHDLSQTGTTARLLNGTSITVTTAIVDTDNDGVPDSIDNCPITPNPEQIAFFSNRNGANGIYTMNSDGSNVVALTTGNNENFPSFSLNGSKIAFFSTRDHSFGEIYVMDSDGSNLARLTNNTVLDTFPSISPDGSKVVFVSNRGSGLEIYMVNSDGTNEVQLTNFGEDATEPAFSPDGSKIVFTCDTTSGGDDVCMMNTDGTDFLNLTQLETADDFDASFSPDGSKIAFVTLRNSASPVDLNFEIYVMNSDGTNQVRLTNTTGSSDEFKPRFSADGSKIVFETDRDGNDEIYVMNADGTGPVRLTIDSGPDRAPAWGAQADSDRNGIGDACELPTPTPTPTPTATPDLSVTDVTATEGDIGTTNFAFTVNLSTPAPAGGVTFDISTGDGTAQDDNPAIEDNDYVAKSLTSQTIAAGNSTYTFDVTVNGDLAFEPNETFLVNITNVIGANVTDGQGQGTIQNDDVAYTVTYDGNGNTGGTAPVDADNPYNPAEWVGVAGPGDLVNTGYTFGGWNTAANGSGIHYNPAQSFAINADTTLYAQWIVEPCFETASGSLDSSFDGDGKVTTPVGTDFDEARAVAVQQDGKIVAAGYGFNGSNNDFALVRYNTDGSLDTSFDTDGKVTTAIGSSADLVLSVAIQPDGKIVAAGYSYNGSNDDFALARYNTDGSPDTTFDTDGKLTTAIGIFNDQAFSVAIQPDGKIVATGWSLFGPTSDFALVRYNADGSLDTTFDTDGKLTTAIGISSERAYSVAIQPDGKIVAAGYSYNGSNDDFALVRYNSDGSPDTTFDTDGKLTTAIGSNNDFAYSVAIQPDGRIVVAGYSYNGSNDDFALVRYNTDGSLDTSFDTDGKVTTGVLSSHDNANSVAIQPDGMIVAAGSSFNGSNNDFALVRYNTDGSLDTAFDVDGKATTAVLSDHDQAYSVAIQPDGRIVAAGNSFNGTNFDFALVRYGGSCDSTPPDTNILTGPSGTVNTGLASFTFDSTETGSTFECAIDGGAFAACATLQSYTGLAEGSHIFAVRAKDAAGNTDLTPAERTWTVDTTPPDTTISASPPNPSNSVSVSFSFSSGEIGAAFECSIDGGAFTACTSPQNYSALADGQHTFAVRATDAAGNADPTPASHTWTVDTTPPDTTITANPPANSNSGSAAFEFTSNESGAAFECSIDSGAFTACTSPQNYTGLADGQHTFAVKATDAAGNADATPASHTWVVDITPPDTTITANPTNPSNAATAGFSFTGSDTGGSGVDGFECQLNGGGFAACTSPQTYIGVADGSHTFNVRAIDRAGNRDEQPAAFTWTVDTTTPDTVIDSTPVNPSNSASAAFTFSGTDGGSGVGSFECQIDGGAFTACTSPQNYTGLAEGQHTFQVRAVDAAGNADPTPAAYMWMVDTTPPDTSITANPTDPTSSTSASFSFTSNETGAAFECSIDAGAFAACTSPAAFNNLVDGPHTFTVRATDAVGNVDPTPASNVWTVDSTPPDTTITSNPTNPTTSTSAAFTFTSNETGATFACSLDGAAFTACTSPQSYTGLALGSHAFQVRASDTASNTDPTPASYTWVINSPPTIAAAVGVTRVQAAGASVSQIATVGDADQAANTLAVTVNGGAAATVNGVTVSSITIAPSGAVSASVAAACGATNASFTLRVTDSGGLFAQATLNVTVINEAIPPVIDAITDVVATLPSNSPATSMAVNFPLPTAIDNCSAAIVTTAPISGSVFPAGTTVVNVTAMDALGNVSTTTFNVAVQYPFTGFAGRVMNAPAVNYITAGNTIPILFSLGGDRGLDIFADGSPSSQQVNCVTGTPIGPSSPSNGILMYLSGQYAYYWITEPSQVRTCRTLSMTLNDGMTRTLKFWLSRTPGFHPAPAKPAAGRIRIN